MGSATSSAEPTGPAASVNAEREAVDDPDYDLPPVLSARRPTSPRRSPERNPDEDKAPDTIPAPMWFVEE